MNTIEAPTGHKRKALVFAREFGDDKSGEPDVAEGMKAGVAMKELAHDTICKHLPYIGFPSPDDPRAELMLEYPIDELRGYDIFIKAPIDNVGMTAEILIKEFEGDRYGLEHRYHIDENGILRRYDHDPSSDHAKAKAQMYQLAMERAGIDKPPDFDDDSDNNRAVLAAYLEHALPAHLQSIEYDKQAKKEGRNDQPIDPAEVENLATIIMRASPVKEEDVEEY